VNHFLFLCIFLTTNVFAFKLSNTQKLQDLEQLSSYIQSGYGPLKYKEKNLNIYLDKLKEKYSKKISNTRSNGEFYYDIVKFIAEFKDGHFSAKIKTDHKAYAGFIVNYVNEKVLIDSIDREQLPKDKFEFEKGDEVVEVDGVAIEKFLNKYSKYVASGYALTSKAIAAYYVSSRKGNRVPVPTSKNLLLKIRKGTSNIIEEVSVDWKFTGTPLDEYKDFGNEESSFLAKKSSKSNLYNLSISQKFNDILGDKIDATYHCNGDTRIAYPKDATIIMKKPFVAYYHKTAKGNVGYLRIPHYSPKNKDTGKEEFKLRFEQYEYAISELEKNTVGLIIDQDHNCGGSVTYLQQIVSLFISKETLPMQFKLLANKSEYLGFKSWLDETNEFTLEHQAIKQVTTLVKDAWINDLFMTKMTSISGLEFISPNQIRYTKPIVMLIDKMSGSGGDAFPSLMGGIGRATLFGERTMGLGGHVEEQPNLNNSQIKVRMTKSLFFRPDGVAVENNGAVPDINYSITRNDFLYKFKDYQKAYLKVLLEKIK